MKFLKTVKRKIILNLQKTNSCRLSQPFGRFKHTALNELPVNVNLR